MVPPFIPGIYKVALLHHVVLMQNLGQVPFAVDHLAKAIVVFPIQGIVPNKTVPIGVCPSRHLEPGRALFATDNAILPGDIVGANILRIIKPA
jgi:hypothetical protein